MHRKGKLLCGTLVCCNRGPSSEWKMCFLWFRLNSKMLNISFVMGMFTYKNWSKCTVGTLIFDVF